MKLEIVGSSQESTVKFKLVHEDNRIRLAVDRGDGFRIIASFCGGTDEAFLYIDRIEDVGFKIFNGYGGEL